MFGFRKSKHPDKDPLSGLQAVSRWMEELLAGDVYAAQERVVQCLDQFNHAQLPVSAERLQAFLHLDARARGMQHALCTQYLGNPRMSQAIESRLWTTIHTFYWEITSGYQHFLEDFVTNRESSPVKTIVPLITARTLRGFADRFKWHYFRNERVEARLWLKVHNLYRLAKTYRFEHRELKLYDFDAGASSVEIEYIRILLLSLLGSGSLTPRQIEMVDQWLDNWSRLLHLENVYQADRHVFQVDTAKGQGLHRNPGKQGDSCLFLDTRPLIDHIETVTRALKTGATPVTLGLGEEFRLPDGYELLELVAGEWSSDATRERRASPREAIGGQWQVIRDLDNICAQLQSEQDITPGTDSRTALSQEELLDIKVYGFVTERTKNAAQDQTSTPRRTISDLIAHWKARDRSETGLSVMIRIEEGDWIKAGTLLALREDSGASWQIGVIRRIERFNEEWRILGVKAITHQAELVYLDPEETHRLSYLIDDNYISRSAKALRFSDDSADFVIMEGASYAYGKPCKLLTHEALRHIHLDAVRDKGESWLMAAYSTEREVPV